ncbi:MAG: hypothetical protein AAFZ10_00235 [Pseudomonadota bacterium]
MLLPKGSIWFQDRWDMALNSVVLRGLDAIMRAVRAQKVVNAWLMHDHGLYRRRDMGVARTVPST